ncbi:polysaccharide biosynthesis protein [Beggiatoa sp. PS]|nr:polysaccharide biosynthesis protein [Beggiatoa sp. PS]
MSLRTKALKGAGLLSVSQVISYGLSFVRNIILARLLGPEQFGMAATFLLTVSLLEMSSNFNLDKLLIQSKQGDDPDFQATVHSFQVLRGILLSVVLLLLAYPISAWFNLSQSLWAYQCLAIIPLIRAFLHLDNKRCQRNLNYLPEVSIELVQQTLTLIAAVSLLIWWQDYRVVLGMLIIQAMVLVVTSHLVAQRQYSLGWHPLFAKQMIQFGWPLLLNGILLYIIFQGDKVAVGRFFSMTELGLYTVAATLAMIAAELLVKIIVALFLPLLSKVQNDTLKFTEQYQFLSDLLIALAIALSTVFIIASEPIIHLFYGEAYQTAAVLMIWLSIAQAIGLMRLALTVAALAKGDSRSPTWASAYRVLGLLGIVWAVQENELIWIVFSAIAAEVLAFVMLAIRLKKLFSLPLLSCIKALSTTVIIIPVIFLLEAKLIHELDSILKIFCAFGIAGMVFIMLIVKQSNLRLQLLNIFKVNKK